ncbi:unnamed protein product [Arabis nemorensis]|uniref:Uncharacterized protein n=1 Tax=Arabis nemorensis TaxID=586526 RepID=A0A565BKF4_9BRAS|nr:unnamed protein product [Arabis nemorensis]
MNPCEKIVNQGTLVVLNLASSVSKIALEKIVDISFVYAGSLLIRTMVMERWVPELPSDFLSSFLVWIRIRNIPANHYTIETMDRLGSAIGELKEIAYGLKVSQKTEYVKSFGGSQNR